jgi:RNA polymerase-binding protein DksA
MQSNADIRQRLLDRRRALLRRYRDELERADEELANRPSETAERAAEEWDAEILSHLGDGDARAISAVVSALARLDQGTYGACAICRHPISAARLLVMPEAATCIACATSRDGIAESP